MTQFIQHFLSPEGVLTLTLHRPKEKNALTTQMLLTLHDNVKSAQTDTAIRLIVFKAIGDFFCAGADIKEIQEANTITFTENKAKALVLANFLDSLYHSSKPTLAIVQGGTYGEGIGLVAACDIIISSSKAFFCIPEVKHGLIPSIISPYVIEALGTHQALYFMLTGNILNAERAYELGFTHLFETEENYLFMAEQVTHNLLKGGPDSLIKTKKLVQNLYYNDFLNPKTKFKMAEALAYHRASQEAQEGTKAFLAKREPSWIKS